MRGQRSLVRVFIPTFRRHELLPRAVESLCKQSLTDWVCEVHNDDPQDVFPSELLHKINDSRFKIVNHTQNLGASATFNLFYRAVAEPFCSLLEDDNWWDETFLETLVGAMQLHPEVSLAWCNQKIWEELPDGTWRDTGELANPPEEGAGRLVEFGQMRQVMGAQHANGAMVLRSCGTAYQTPVDCPFTWMEATRERMIPHPFLYVPKPLAVFGRTRKTSRSLRRAEWVVGQTMLAASFLKYARYSDAGLEKMIFTARHDRPPSTNALLLAALVEEDCRNLLRHSKTRDWLLLLKGLVRRPNVLWKVIHARRRHPNWWQILEQHTMQRFTELRRGRGHEL